MSRFSAAAFAAALLLSAPLPGRAAEAPAAPARPPMPSLTPGPAAGAEADPAVRELVRREVEKAKEDMREEMRAELMSQQSMQSLSDTAGTFETRKLDFLELHGYLRVRSDLFDNFDLHRGPDPSGYYLFPRPLRDADNRGTLTSDNLRFRLEPTLNVSEQVRVLAQLDLLDNIVFGSTPEGFFARSDGLQFPFDSRGQTVPSAAVNADRDSVRAKRAWAEVQTPLGLLSFGRMPSSWGLGMLSHAGEGIDDDLGDSVDRVQFALAPIGSPIGKLVLVPMYEIISTGVTSEDQRSGYGIGQPFDRDRADDAKAIGLKVVRLDTADEMKRRWERGEASNSFGAWYMYKYQDYTFPTWAAGSTVNPITGTEPTSPPSTGSSNENLNDPVGSAQRVNASAHQLDLWFRHQTKKFRLELELAGITGQTGPVLIRQFGGVAQASWKLGRFTVGGELGLASGDSNPGFGNRPSRGCVTSNGKVTCPRTAPGDFEGAQYQGGDRILDIRNFRFNPAYRVDLILFREIIQGITDAFYIRPDARYEIFDGFDARAAIIYSQAMYASSTPSQVSAPLGLELDLGLHYRSGDGFVAWLDYGLLQPLSGLEYSPSVVAPAGRDVTRAHAFRFGLGVEF